jgi:RHS repeat-associated protein
LTAAAASLLGVAAALAQPVPLAATTTYRYDETANKVTQVDARGRETTWTVDAKDRVAGRLLPDGSRETSAYDHTDNLLAKTTFAGEQFTFTYDVNDRVASQLVPAGAGSNQAVAPAAIQFRYTPTGQLSSRQEQGATTLAGEQTFKYDAMDRVLESRGPVGLINYGRDAAGNITQRSVAGAGTAQYEYDDAGRMTRVIAPDGKQTRYSYDAAGRLDLIERDLRDRAGQAQVLVTSYVYDQADRIVTIAHIRKQGAAMALLSGQKVTRSPGGAIVQIETDRGDGSSSTTGTMTARSDVRQVFDYDSLGRLAREIRSDPGGTVDNLYEYDLVGNRTRKTVVSSAGAEITNYNYDVADRLVEEVTTLPAGGSRVVAYTWDANGNLASKTAPGSVTLYRFDPRNRLIDIRQGATLPQAQAAEAQVRYAYDAEGNRVRKWGADARAYLVDTEEVFAHVVRETSATESIDYLRGLGLIRQTRSGASGSEELYPLPGHLGTSLGAVNADGDVVEQVDADAFGNLDAATGAKQVHLYAGEFWDQDSQLLYLRARWYDPRIGRFISADPFEGLVEAPGTLHRYAYAHSDPVTHNDPSGMFIGIAGITVQSRNL